MLSSSSLEGPRCEQKCSKCSQTILPQITGKKMGPTAFQTSLSGAMAGACQGSILPLNGRSVPEFNPPP
eukprot:4922075-Pyramimonas_sp.AAC.1